jgi:hypothetical protein
VYFVSSATAGFFATDGSAYALGSAYTIGFAIAISPASARRNRGRQMRKATGRPATHAAHFGGTERSMINTPERRVPFSIIDGFIQYD